MFFSDLNYIFSWWTGLFLIGVVFLPLTSRIFSGFFDKGYVFSKILGILLISYFIWLLGSLKILPFTQLTIFLIVALFLLLNILISKSLNIFTDFKKSLKLFFFEEAIFLITLFFWSFIRAHEPSIHGLEKYMDFGFINSILRTDYFPPRDVWLNPLSINYYYFGHLVTAVLTKLSGINSAITYNLMLATIFALTFTGAFSIGANLVHLKSATQNLKLIIITGLLSAFLVTLAGNLHTIYAFFSPYNPDNPFPFWQLPFTSQFFNYWYPNATRFIPFTIHEFPIYSFVVSDLHGHVLSIPIVLTIITLLFNILISRSLNIFKFALLAFLIAVAYMTNAWDGLIYGALTGIVFIYLGYRSRNYALYATRYMLIIIGGIIFSLPFSLNFQPFATGIGIICAPKFLTKIGKLGPFLFESNHCQRSALWQLVILYGFFYFFAVSFTVFIARKLNTKRYALRATDIFIFLLILLSTLLVIVPEFIYIKDIYPAHYRANTMFKLGYQAFIMLSLASGYIIIKISNLKSQISNYWKLVVFVIGSIGLLLVMSYPFFAINSYYGSLKNYQGLDGLSYLKNLYPTDYEAIIWLQNNIRRQPVIVEAVGESYTDYARVSANTGLPTIMGWPVHEWLWRGTYDAAAPRIADVQMLYESQDINLTKQLLQKHRVSLVFMGDLERQKYQNIFENKFRELGKIVFESGQTRIYQVGF